jgi:Kelch motif
MGPDGCLYAIGGFENLVENGKQAECLSTAERYDFE